MDQSGLNLEYGLQVTGRVSCGSGFGFLETTPTGIVGEFFFFFFFFFFSKSLLKYQPGNNLTFGLQVTG